MLKESRTVRRAGLSFQEGGAYGTNGQGQRLSKAELKGQGGKGRSHKAGGAEEAEQ